MTRYLRLYAYFLRFSFSRAMEFRFDFFFRVGMDALWYVVNFAFFTVIYLHTPLLGGWNYDQVKLFVAGVFLSDALQMTVFSNNMWWLPFFVNKGDLDYYLTRPVSSLFFLSLRDFAANSFLNLLMTFGIMAWALATYPHELGGGVVVLYLALLAVGVFLQYCLQMIFLIPVFWLHTGRGLREIFFSMSNYTSRPDGIYGGWVRRVLTSILPLALIVSFPTRALFEGDPLGIAVHVVGVTAAAFVVMLWFWRLGLRSYASASS